MRNKLKYGPRFTRAAIIRTAAPLVLSLAGLGVLANLAVNAAEFRKRIPIRSPNQILSTAPEGATPVERIEPVDRRLVEAGLRDIFNALTSDPAAFNSYLAPSFTDRNRLSDTLAERLPRDAKLKILAMQGVRTLSQFVQPDPETGGTITTSTVSATARTQLEFNDSVQGFQRLEGVGEYIIEVQIGKK